MWSVRGRSLRSQIAGGVLAGLIVLFSVFGLLALQTINLTVDVALEERLRLARISAESLDDLLEHTSRQLERATAFVGRVGMPAEELRALDVYELLGEFDRIIRLGPDDEVEWMVPPGGPPPTWLDSSGVTIPALTDRSGTRILSPTHGDPSGDLLAIIITPLAPHDPTRGSLAGELRAAHAGVSLLSLPSTDGSLRAEIVDAAGYVVAQPMEGDHDAPDAHVAVLGPMIAAGRPGTTIHVMPDGADHVVAYYPFRSRPGGIVVEQTEDAAFAIPRDMQATMLIYGVIALVLASVGAWLHASSVVRPIRGLTGASARMASGDLDTPIAVARDDEIGELARRFDEMRLKLKSSLEESARWATELEHRVADRTREVEARNRELDVLNRSRRLLLAKTISAQEEERKRLARELHDDSAQTLAAVLMTLASAENALPVAPEAARQTIERSRSQLEGALREIRKAILDLRPSALDDLGLAAAIRWYADQHLARAGIKVAVDIAGDERQATPAAATVIFRIAQEAVNNAARHSGASSVRISLAFGAADIAMTVEDDGAGFDPERLRQPEEDGRGLGLLGMRERAELFGGEVEIVSSAGRGTTIRVRMPYD